MIVSALLFPPVVAVRVQKLFGIRTIHFNDAVLIALGSMVLAGYAMADSAPARVAACSILAGIGLYACARAMRCSAGAAEMTPPVTLRSSARSAEPRRATARMEAISFEAHSAHASLAPQD